MHELQIASELVRILSEEKERHGVERILSATVRVGELTCIEPEALKVAFEICSEGSPVQGVELRFEVLELTGTCEDCQEIFPCSDTGFVCPSCGKPPSSYPSGDEFHVASMEVAD